MSSGWNEDALVNDLHCDWQATPREGAAVDHEGRTRPLDLGESHRARRVFRDRDAGARHRAVVDGQTALSLARDRAPLAVAAQLARQRSLRARIALHDITYPCILKPAVKNSEFRKKSPRKAFKAYDARQLTEAYDLVSSWEPEVVVQEWIDGGDDRVAFGLGYWNARSQPLALFPGGRSVSGRPNAATPRCRSAHRRSGATSSRASRRRFTTPWATVVWDRSSTRCRPPDDSSSWNPRWAARIIRTRWPC